MSGENVEINLPEPVVAKKIEKPVSSEAPAPRVYNLLKKVEGMTRRAEVIPDIGSDWLLAKELHRLVNRRDSVVQSIVAHEAEYAAKYGEDAVQSAKQELERLSIRIQEIGRQRASEAMSRRTERLEATGYSS